MFLDLFLKKNANHAMYKMISKIKTKTQEPCIYALCFNADYRRMVQVIAYSLEEAIDAGLSKLKIADSVMPEMYCFTTLADFRASALVADMIPTKETEQKNELMQQIIADKDFTLMNKKKKLFTLADVEYMKNAIDVATREL